MITAQRYSIKSYLESAYPNPDDRPHPNTLRSWIKQKKFPEHRIERMGRRIYILGSSPVLPESAENDEAMAILKKHREI